LTRLQLFGTIDAHALTSQAGNPSQNPEYTSQIDRKIRPTTSKIIKIYKMNLKSTICCTLLFLTLVDATNRHLRGGRGRGRGPALSWSVITSPQDPDVGINIIPESVAPGEPNPGKPSCAIGNRGIAACRPIFAPVLCGDNCQYENLCSAQAGPGFTKEDCKPVAKEKPVNWSVDAQCAKPKLTRKGCPEIFSPVRCDDCIYDNICFATAAGFLRDCEPAKVYNMPVPEDTVPGNPTVVDTVVVHNMPVPEDTLLGIPPVVDMVVVHEMPVPEDSLPVNTNGTIEEPATEPIEEPTTGMGPSTIAIGEPNPATPILIGDLAVHVKPSKPIEEPTTGMRPSTIAIGELNPAIPIPDTHGRAIPGKPPVSVISGTEEATSAYPDTHGMDMIIPERPSASIPSNNEGGTWAYSDTPGMIIPGRPPVSVLIGCRETRSGVSCDEDDNPVLCGAENCLYGNLCLGIGAGFSETDCGSDR
jgi:hypothetical protein